ncbi:MAG: 4-hydroxy-3-methylbut-2-enyl diphosphate reductase [Deltaproteobacteria bacterium]|nr:4-hydroxy-3-methylbut-2-enyl diphosphate reductase [Deltaproteobacteria bacterium]
MTKIIVTQNAGFCFGVERATKIAFDASKAYKEDLYTLGPIIHNPQVVNNLEKEGVKAKKELDDINGGTVIIRSHGVSSDVMEKVRNRDLNVLDATCPFVKKAQKMAEKLSNEGYTVLIVGDGKHPEVRGIVSYVRGEVIVAGTVDEVKKISKQKKLGIVAQTTQSLENFNKIVDVCMEKAEDINVCNTICDATEVRQEESVDLAKKVDCMIVIGGYNSANTKRLTSLCLEIQPNTHHIESALEIREEWVRNFDMIGITAGASTPSEAIEEVRKKVEELCL